MQNIKKYFMTLALLIMAVGGAWAQSSLKVVEIEVPAGWASDFSNVTAGDLTGFSASTLDKAQAWTGAPTEGNAVLFYAFDGENVSYVYFEEGEFSYEDKGAFSKVTVFGESNSMKFYYTAEITEWSLTPDADKKVWTLAEMPASNVELQVEYYAESNIFLGKEALADKASIAVKNGETTVEFGDDGKSTTTVTEGNTVTAKFTGKKVLGMKVEKKAELKTFDCDGTVLVYEDGDTWADVIARNPDKISQSGNLISHVGMEDCLQIGENFVYPDHKVDPNANYKWEDG